MDSMSGHINSTYNSQSNNVKTAQMSAWLPDINPPLTLTPDQQAALEKVLKETTQNESDVKPNQDATPTCRSRRRVALILIVLVFVLIAACVIWYYWETSYATFEYILQPIVILEGQRVDANDFLVPVGDIERVSAVFRRSGDTFNAGRHNVPLTLNRGLRTVDTTASLHVLTTISEVRHELAERAPELNAIDFVSNANAASEVAFDVRFTEKPGLLEDYPVGKYTLYLALNGAPFEVLLTVEDTTPPEATAVNRTIWIGEQVVPEEFVTDIFDASMPFHPVNVTFYNNEPNTFGHDQIVQIKIEDYSGNYNVISSGLTIVRNTEPPVFSGTDTIVSMLGDPIMYLTGVTAYDDFGRDITDRITIDAGEVDQFTEGVYTVIFRVTDLTGNLTEREERVHIVTVEAEYVFGRVDEILESILTDDMTQLEEVQAIFMWVRRNVFYAPVRGGPQSSVEGAYRALTDRRGNCYIFYSISEVMLTRAGIPNMLIERIPGTPTAHRWNLVNPDNLGWHHFDSLGNRLNMGIQMAFFTSTQAAAFTEQMANLGENARPDYYTYDPTLYPEIVQ